MPAKPIVEKQAGYGAAWVELVHRHAAQLPNACFACGEPLSWAPNWDDFCSDCGSVLCVRCCETYR